MRERALAAVDGGSSIRFLSLSSAEGVAAAAVARRLFVPSYRLLDMKVSAAAAAADRNGDRNSQSNLADPIGNPSDCAGQFVPARLPEDGRSRRLDR